MDEAIELSIEAPHGIIDCRLELSEEERTVYQATVLYPKVSNGFSRSEVYCFDLVLRPGTGKYFFAPDDDIPAKIRALEGRISDAIAAHLKDNKTAGRGSAN